MHRAGGCRPRVGWRRTLQSALLAAFVASGGCSKGDPPRPPSTDPVPEVAVSPSREPATSAPPPSPSATAAPRASSAPAAPRASAIGAASSADGGRRLAGGPPFPLQAWMKSTVGPALNAGDFATVAAALEKVAADAPPTYPNWRSIAKDGADAARVEDAEAVKAACRACHEQYKGRYRSELRDRPI